MELGQKLRQARLERGLSQRQLCGDLITRNMLSQIENGSARPSMDTLCALAERLGKPVSYFLEEGNANFSVIEQARTACGKAKWEAVFLILEQYQTPDRLFDPEYVLLRILALLGKAEKEAAVRPTYARALLEEAEQLKTQTPYYTDELEYRRRLLLGELSPETVELPRDDRALLLYARGALGKGDLERCAAWLTVCEDQNSPIWHHLRGDVALASGDYAQAATQYHLLEDSFPREVFPKLEQCYQALENYQMAYIYACKQREMEKEH